MVEVQVIPADPRSEQIGFPADRRTALWSTPGRTQVRLHGAAATSSQIRDLVGGCRRSYAVDFGNWLVQRFSGAIVNK